MKSPNSCIAIIGMPTSGKTTLGEQLADELDRSFADSDQIFEAAHGVSIKEYVEKYGWPSFRSDEEKIVEASIKPNTVLSLGGGAIESGNTRSALAIKTHVVWIRAKLQTILERWRKQQQGQERPQLTSHSLEQETAEKFERRNPLFESIADVVVEAEDLTEKQIKHIRSLLNM